MENPRKIAIGSSRARNPELRFIRIAEPPQRPFIAVLTVMSTRVAACGNFWRPVRPQVSRFIPICYLSHTWL